MIYYFIGSAGTAPKATQLPLATSIEEVFSLACHFAFIVPHDVIHVYPGFSFRFSKQM
jgi:hypothetical protein